MDKHCVTSQEISNAAKEVLEALRKFESLIKDDDFHYCTDTFWKEFMGQVNNGSWWFHNRPANFATTPWIDVVQALYKYTQSSI